MIDLIMAIKVIKQIMAKDNVNHQQLTHKIIGCAMDVH
jgi:hypothetical protein